MGKVYCILICFLIVVPTRAQVNLILNPSFEILDSCPTSENQISRAKYWDNLDNNSAFYCWNTLIHACCINPMYCGINTYANGGVVHQFPKTGNGYCLLEIPPPP